MIAVPKEFQTFGIWLNQDADYLYGPTLEAMWAGALKHVPPEGRAHLRNFVDEVLKANYTDRELIDIWSYSGADWDPHTGFARQSFALIRATLDVGCEPYCGPLDEQDRAST